MTSEPRSPAPPGRVFAAVIGGGVVGLATARAIQTGGDWSPDARPIRSVTVLEKESGVGTHQTGRNSGVIHSGLYYAPGSLKAVLCRRGVELLTRFCREHGVRFARPGKVIVAGSAAERERLQALKERGDRNGVPGLRLIGREELLEREPSAGGEAALWSPTTGIVRFRDVALRLAALIERDGGVIHRNAPARAIALDRAGEGAGEVVVAAGDAEVRCRVLVNCAGLHADRVARLAGDDPEVLVAPFRGGYFRLRPERSHLVRGMIYPVPDPRFPFLGLHVHRTPDGGVEAGPNAAPALAREGYRRLDLSASDLAEMIRFPGWRRLLRREWRFGANEIRRSVSRRTFARALARLVPDIAPADLVPGGSGVRAVALSPDGRLVDDFHVLQKPGRVHVLNAPSPAATAALAIGARIARLAAESA